MPEFVAIGDNCVDIYLNLGMTFPGGGPVNFAVQVRRLGIQSAYIGAVGDDIFGDWILAALTEERVDTRNLLRLPGSTARAYVQVTDGERVFVGSEHGVREQLKITQEMTECLARSNLIHTTLDGGVDEYLAEWNAMGKMLSYDFSHRATTKQISLLPYIYVAFFSGQYVEKELVYRVLRDRHEKGARVVVMTLGPDGSAAYDGELMCYQPAEPAEVIDTLGAGDAFQAGFIAEYVFSRSLETALHAGAVRASQACGHYGGFGHGHVSLTE